MVVAMRVRPLGQKEKEKGDLDIISVQEKLILVLDRVQMQCDENGKKVDVLHRSKE